MTGRIAYFGDDDLDGAAAYLGGVMTWGGLEFVHIPSDSVFPGDLDPADFALFILSDYPAARLGEGGSAMIKDRVTDGAGLLMIGGWETFQGSGGDYHGTKIAEMLPVLISDNDDRVNSHEPCLVEAVEPDHPILSGLPWDKVPAVAGFNSVKAKADGKVLLKLHRLDVGYEAGEFSFDLMAEHPLLVVGTAGKGRTAAFTSDVAPHWVGGMVDWGPDRIAVRAEGGGEVEIGHWYAEFFLNLVRWCMNE